MKDIILIAFCIFTFVACKKHKENRLTGTYTGDYEYTHMAVNKESGDTTIFSTDAYYNKKVQIVRDDDSFIFIRDRYVLPINKVKLNKRNVITVEEFPKEYVLELDVFTDEIGFTETIQSDISYSYTYQIFEFTGFRE